LVRAELDPKALSGPDARAKPELTLVFGGVGALALIVALLVYFFWPWVHVPDVAGRSEREAVAVLEQTGFHSQREEEPSEAASPGTVIRTSPAAGQIVDKGAPLTVVIAVPVRLPSPRVTLAPPRIRPMAPVKLVTPALKVAVPLVVGRPEVEATAALGRVGLKWQAQEEPSEASPGTVIGTSPAAEEMLAPGETVTLAVAVPMKVSVPPIVGRPEADAAATLERAGLKWQRQEQPSDAPPGTVIGTSPKAEQVIVKGETVTFSVAVPFRVSVPAVAGQTMAQAAATLEWLGLKWQQQGEPSENATPGTVIGISPATGQMVDKGSIVTLLVGIPVRVAVPPVLGQTAAAATAALTRAGLKWQRQDEPNESISSGSVINSSPSAGEVADKGSIVVLTVAVPARVAVPRVVGQPVTGAIATLAKIGLKSQRQDQPSERVAAGRVISTSPAAGQLVDKGATITLVVAKAVRAQASRVTSQPESEVAAVPHDSTVREPASQEPATGSLSPWGQAPPHPAAGGGSAPWGQTSPYPGGSTGPLGAPWGPTPSYGGYSAPAAPPRGPMIPLDPVISHLYDNAHR
jgi:beta-lactam-binding protein with PASTA domain